MALKARCEPRTGALQRPHAQSHVKPFVCWPRRSVQGQRSSGGCAEGSTSGAVARSAAALARWSSLLRTRAAMADAGEPAAAQAAGPALICTSVTATTMTAFLAEIKEAEASGVDVIELRLDFIQGFEPERDLEALMAACTLPYIVTYRPKWEG